MTMDIRRFGNIVFIPGADGARYPHCNSLFIDDEVKAVIDPGCDEAYLRDLAAGRRINRREAELLDALESPLSLDEIVEQWIIYGRQRKPRYFFDLGEREMMRKHLERLVASGRVIKKNKRYALA